ncbi:MAG: LAGLIDADG family homing endonuclease [Candidatus Nanohaloarchaea archaeon]
MIHPNLKDDRLAEFTGLMLGDGSIGKYTCKKGDGTTNTQRSVCITLSSEEKQYADYIDNLVEELFGIKLNERVKKDENVRELRTFRIDIFEFLTKDLELECSPKWERAKIPEIFLDKNLEKRVLRGYFDTDGSVVLTDNNGTLYPRLEMKISPSPMQNQFESILERNGFKICSYDIGKGKVRIQMNGKTQLKKWMKEIGFSNRKHLEKAERALA